MPPSVLIVTGSWHIPQHYHKVISQLEAGGIRVLCPCLPISNNVLPPNHGIGDDVAFIRELVAKETAEGTQLFVLAHSYGGVVSTAALAEFEIKQGSNNGGVLGILYICAFMPTEKQSLAGIFGGQLPPFLTYIPEYNTIMWGEPIQHLYNDLPEAEAPVGRGPESRTFLWRAILAD
ncbi:Fc.00g031450.m01.CDS01 [Cosmosporella sp. VM-42]